MAGPSSYPKNSLYVFSLNSSSSSSSSSLSSMKLKTLVHCTRFVRALSRAKSILIQILKDVQLIQCIEKSLKKNKKRKNKLYFGSFRLHYNWCSSHVLPVPSPIDRDGYITHDHVYYDSTWNSKYDDSTWNSKYDDRAESQLSGYLQWLEEKKVSGFDSGASDHTTKEDIDTLADMFIANCHEKFRLEKQESYRRFQEMLARSV